MIVHRNDITSMMANISEASQKINRFICPHKEIQPQKGVQLGRIHSIRREDGSVVYTSMVWFPKWVQVDCPDDPSKSKGFVFECDENGNFIRWLS